MALNLSGLPTSALQPGQTGAAVQQLQQWLVANNFLSQAAYNTGPGTYGPATTAAVTALQKSLGVNTQGNDGYFGPLTISAIQNSATPAQTTQPTQTTTSPTQTTTPTLGAQNQNVPAGAETPGYTYVNGVLTSVGGVPTGNTNAPTQSVNLTPVGGNGSQVVANAIPKSQFQGYNLPTAGDFVYNGQVYQINGQYVLPDPNFPAFLAKDLSTYAVTSSGTSSTDTTNTSSTSTGLTYNANYGVSQDQWNQMNDVQKATTAAIYTAKQQSYQTNGQALAFADALTQAAQDPNIVAQFADAAKLDAQAFQQNLAQIQQSQSTTGQQQQQQFETDRKNLAEQQAANGTAYSGFRGEAQKQLGDTESGIVQSSRSALQKQLNDATSQFEQKYGTVATTPATATFTDPTASSNISLSGQYSPNGTQANTLLTGTTAGNITGTQPIAQQNAINSKATDLYNLANVTPTVA